MVAPLLDDDSRLLQTVEDFPVEALVAQLAVERFAVAIFPVTAGLDVERALRITAHDLCGLRAIAGVLLVAALGAGHAAVAPLDGDCAAIAARRDIDAGTARANADADTGAGNDHARTRHRHRGRAMSRNS